MPGRIPCEPGCVCKKHSRSTYAGKPVQTPSERREVRLAARARYRDANREKVRTYNREYQRANGSFKRHGLRPEQIAEMWEAQGGRCCYCERPLPRDGKVVIDHDHTCCPPMSSCVRCRRGLAHNNCNVIVGLAAEDWDLLLAIAANGRPLSAAVREQIDGRPIQTELPLNVKPLRRDAG